MNRIFLGRLLVHRILPMGAVEVLHAYTSDGRWVEAVRHHSISVRVGPWLVETLNAADTTERVLRLMSVECVGCQIIFTLDQFEPAFRDNEVTVLLFGADATIAVIDKQVSWCEDLERHPTTVTSTLVQHQLRRRHFYGRRQKYTRIQDYILRQLRELMAISLAHRCFAHHD